VRSRGAVAVLIAGLVMTASAAAEDPPAREARINVFISPSGEPFRAAPGQPYPVDAWFARADANHDGKLSEQEFVADAVGFFHRLDANGDGVIDGFEIDDYEQKVAPEILPHVGGLTARDIPPLPAQDPDEQRRRELAQAQQQQQEADKSRQHGPVYTGAAVFGLIREPEPVAAADLDFDGKVTLAEMAAAARRHFDELDLNHDGYLTRDELPKTPAEKLAEKQAKDRLKRKH
jgi:hypothetical protein